MAKNFVQHGAVIPFTAPTGGVTNGLLQLIGALAAVADHSAEEGELFEGHLTGVWEFNNKASADEPEEGEAAYLTANGQTLTTANTAGNFKVGVFLSSGGNGSTACRVRLDGVSVSAVPAP